MDLHNADMLNVHELSPQDFVGMSPVAAAELVACVLAHVGQQSRQIESPAQAISLHAFRMRHSGQLEGRAADGLNST